MGLFRNVLKSGYLIRVGHQNQGISSSLGDFPRAFSTAADGTTQGSPSILDPFLHNPATAVTYGKLSGITLHTTKSDIHNLLEGCNLTLDDIKAEYNLNYSAMNMLIRFPSRNAYDNALRTLNRRKRAYKMTGAFAEHWEAVSSYNGKAVLLRGIPRTALQDDIDRFLSGCHHDETSMRIFTRFIQPELVRMAVVQFPSSSLATSAFLTKNRGFCLNNQISVRVLQ